MNIPREALEYHCLDPLITDAAVESAVGEAISLRVAGVCIPPYWVKKASRDTLPTGIQLITVIGFPYGYQRTEAKLAEMELAFADGAQEVELTINLSALKSQRWNWIKAEMARFSKGAHDKEKILTVLIDAKRLTREEMLKLGKDAADAGVDFIKITAVSKAKDAWMEIIRPIREALHPSVGLKYFVPLENADSINGLLDAGAEKICVPDLTFFTQLPAKS